MLIFVLENCPELFCAAQKVLAEAASEGELTAFSLPDEALDSARLNTSASGIRAALVTSLSPDERGAVQSWVGRGVLRPVEANQALEELARSTKPDPPGSDRLYVQCFGYFEVYWQGKPLVFGRRQAKELFAFLIDRAGAACDAEQIAAALWEEEQDMKAAKHRLRTVLCDLRNTLRRIGMEEVLIRERRQAAVRRDMLDCDYYRLLDGDAAAACAFRGEYMQQYSWAEPTKGRLCYQGSRQFLEAATA